MRMEVIIKKVKIMKITLKVNMKPNNHNNII